MSDTTSNLDANGFIIKDDPLDLGVPMRPAPAGTTRQEPEDALRGRFGGDAQGGNVNPTFIDRYVTNVTKAAA